MKVSSPFGSQTRTRLLLSLELLGQSYARELARLLRVSLSVVQKALVSLERDGLISGRLVGRTRLFQINPQYFAAEQLRALIARLLVVDRDLKARAADLRRRPRRTGKRL
jgi:DNA-binding transcriptional ArsR family regulator